LACCRRAPRGAIDDAVERVPGRGPSHRAAPREIGVGFPRPLALLHHLPRAHRALGPVDVVRVDEDVPDEPRGPDHGRGSAGLRDADDLVAGPVGTIERGALRRRGRHGASGWCGGAVGLRAIDAREMVQHLELLGRTAGAESLEIGGQSMRSPAGVAGDAGSLAVVRPGVAWPRRRASALANSSCGAYPEPSP
jgi:hypothetical protein